MTPREIIAAILGGIVALLVHLVFDKPDMCRRACCVPMPKGERLWVQINMHGLYVKPGDTFTIEDEIASVVARIEFVNLKNKKGPC